MGAHQKATVSLLYQLQVAAPQQVLHTEFEKSQAGLLLNSGASDIELLFAPTCSDDPRAAWPGSVALFCCRSAGNTRRVLPNTPSKRVHLCLSSERTTCTPAQAWPPGVASACR